MDNTSGIGDLLNAVLYLLPDTHFTDHMVTTVGGIICSMDDERKFRFGCHGNSNAPEQFRLLGNLPPTPPLSQHFALTGGTVFKY